MREGKMELIDTYKDLVKAFGGQVKTGVSKPPVWR